MTIARLCMGAQPPTLGPLEVFRLEKQRIVAGRLQLAPRHCLNCAAIGFERSDKISFQDSAAKVVLQGFLRNETPDDFPLDHCGECYAIAIEVPGAPSIEPNFHIPLPFGEGIVA